MLDQQTADPPFMTKGVSVDYDDLQVPGQENNETQHEAEQRITRAFASKHAELNEQDVQMMVSLRQLRIFFLNGEFKQAHNMLTDWLMRESSHPQQLYFFNFCLVYVLFKLKEFTNAKQMASELIEKIDKETSLSLEK